MLKDMKTDKRAKWMGAFEDECLAKGVPYETIHGANHADFWASATYYFTTGISAPLAAETYVAKRLKS